MHGLYMVPENLQQRKEKCQKAFGSCHRSIQIKAKHVADLQPCSVQAQVIAELHTPQTDS